MLQLITAGVLSAGSAWAINGFILQNFSQKTAATRIIPCLEELLKTASAVMFSVSILNVHVIFGILEGIIDWRNGTNGKASLLSLITHSILGLITSKMAVFFGIFGAIAMASLVHMGWNQYIIYKTMF